MNHADIVQKFVPSNCLPLTVDFETKSASTAPILPENLKVLLLRAVLSCCALMRGGPDPPRLALPSRRGGSDPPEVARLSGRGPGCHRMSWRGPPPRCGGSLPFELLRHLGEH